jgi:hypothetical protein
MKHLYSAVFLAVVSLTGMAAPVLGAGEQGTILVQVDGEPITQKQLDTFFNAFFYNERVRQRVQKLPEYQKEAVLARGRSKALGEMIHRRLLLDAAEERFMKDDKIAEVVERLTRKRTEELKKEARSEVEFVQGLHQRGLSLRQWREYVRETILIQNYLWEKTRSRSRVRPVEVRRYYREHKDQFRRPREIVYRMIIIDPDKCDNPDDERALAMKIRRKLEKGADFAALAERYSLDRDRTEGGLRRVEVPEDDPGWVPAVCEGLSEGEISDVQKTAAGCSIAQLEKIVPAHVAPFEEVQDQIRKRLIDNKRRDARKKLIEQLRKEAHIKVLPPAQDMVGS